MLNVPFCPIKQKLRKKQSEVSMVKIPQHKITKWDIFLAALFTESLCNPIPKLLQRLFTLNSTNQWKIWEIRLERVWKIIPTICIPYFAVYFAFIQCYAPSFRRNLPQIVMHILQKAFFKHALGHYLFVLCYREAIFFENSPCSEKSSKLTT